LWLLPMILAGLKANSIPLAGRGSAGMDIKHVVSHDVLLTAM
jgi:hypothetical protein